MEWDYVAVPGASTALECAFSSMRHIGTDFRNSLSTTTFEAIQILKSAYQNGSISAPMEIAHAAGVMHRTQPHGRHLSSTIRPTSLQNHQPQLHSSNFYS